MVDRFQALARRGHLEFEAWFNAREEPRWSGSWPLTEAEWLFRHCYLSTRTLAGHRVGLPPHLVRRRSPDIIVSPYGEWQFILGWMAARARGIRTAFWVVRTSERWYPRSGWKERVKRHSLPRADGILTPGREATAYAASYGAPSEKTFVVPHPVHSAFLHDGANGCGARRDDVRAELNLQGVTFVYAGRLWWGKGVYDLLQAFTSLQGRVEQDVSLLFVGNGPDGAALRERARGVRNVVFTGARASTPLVDSYMASDVLVFPTLGDPYGLVVEEGMASSLPVISTTAAGEISERLENGREGFLVPPESPETLAARMADLAASPALRAAMGQRGAQRAAVKTPDRWAQDFEAAIMSILSQ
jgi:glycosyltransferase involved in cell wall biosynthesis